MPRKPFDFMIVSLNKNYTGNFRKDDVCIVTPYNWYGNTNGWSKDDPEAATFELEEQKYKLQHPDIVQSERTYWRQERGYVLHSKGNGGGCIVSWSDNHWDVLNIDGKDQHTEDYPAIALEVLEQYLK